MSNRRIRWSLLACYAAAAVMILGACQRETIAPAARQQAPATTATAAADARTVDRDAVIPLVPDVLTRSAVGSQLGSDGTVSAATTQFQFKEGDPIYVSMWIKEAPPGLVVSARWTDPDGEELSVVRKDAEGAKVVTLQLDRKLAPGKYRVEGLWGGNVVLEQELEVGAN